MPPIELQILLQLASEPSHGYRLMKLIAEQTDGYIAPGPATLYVALRRQCEKGLIRQLERPSATNARRRYRITKDGQAALCNEINRISAVLKQAKRAGWNASERAFLS